VQHAQQKGIIHRDLKPSNVLIAQYDGRPVPKMIDFGVAKATGQRLTEMTMFTGFGDVIGTPQYMSPEQAELNQLDVDTRSDIYSLGVLLYELLTGTTPLEAKRVKEAALLEVLRVIREEEPPRPSTRLTATAELPSIAAQRGLEAKSLSGIVKGELDWIVMKALEKDRSRRYETASGLAMDVQRYLSDDTVQACPPSATYRLKKFARRNKAGIITAALTALIFVLATIVSSWQAVRARRAEALANSQRNEALREKARADEEAAIALAISHFYGWELLGQASPERAARFTLQHDPNLTVRAALDRAADRIDRVWGDRGLPEWKRYPMAEAAVCARVSETYSELRDDGRAIEFGERALAIRRNARGLSDVVTLTCMMNLANAYNNADRYHKAESLYLEALPVAHRVLGDYHDTTLLLHQNLANLYCKMGRFDEAETHVARSFGKATTKPHVYQVEILVEIHHHRKEYDKAEALLRETLLEVVKKYGDQSFFAMYVKEHLAKTYVGQRRFAEAEALFLTVLTGYRKLFDGAISRCARVTALLADLYDAWGKPAQAAEWRAKLATTAPATAPASAPTAAQRISGHE
jgi:non-specific serine/threonine protein kinase/serine/threonine-protein kinase